LIRVGIFGVGYVGCTLLVGLARLKAGMIDHTGIPLGECVAGYRTKDIEPVLLVDVDAAKIGARVGDFVSMYPELDAESLNDLPMVEAGVELGSLEGMPIMHAGLDQKLTLEECAQRIKNMIKDRDLDVVVIITPTEEIRRIESIEKLEDAIRADRKDDITACQFYSYCALSVAHERGRGICVINGIPSEIANSTAFVKFAQRTNSVIIGDDISSGQSRLLSDLAEHFRQLNRRVLSVVGGNWGGNADFLRLEDSKRKQSKKTTKTGCLSDVLGYDPPSDIKPHAYIGPLGDKKAILIHWPYQAFNNTIDELWVVGRISDSPSAAGMLIDMIRLGKVALDRGLNGVVPEINSFYCKRFGKQKSKILAYRELMEWLAG
jgi:myo-inositol-1-phosphate synthase